MGGVPPQEAAGDEFARCRQREPFIKSSVLLVGIRWHKIKNSDNSTQQQQQQ
jgi:hypothetical protein